MGTGDPEDSVSHQLLLQVPTQTLGPFPWWVKHGPHKGEGLHGVVLCIPELSGEMLSGDLRILDALGPASLAYTTAKDKKREASQSRWKARSDAQACPL